VAVGTERARTVLATGSRRGGLCYRGWTSNGPGSRRSGNVGRMMTPLLPHSPTSPVVNVAHLYHLRHTPPRATTGLPLTRSLYHRHLVAATTLTTYCGCMPTRRHLPTRFHRWRWFLHGHISIPPVIRVRHSCDDGTPFHQPSFFAVTTTPCTAYLLPFFLPHRILTAPSRSLRRLLLSRRT